MLNDDTRVVLLTLLAQIGVCLGVAGIAAFWGRVPALSALFGGMAAVVPNGFLAARLLTPRAHDARALLRSAWVGVIGKLLLTVIAFGAIFAWLRPVSVPAVFAGFIAAQAVLLGALRFGGGSGSATRDN